MQVTIKIFLKEPTTVAHIILTRKKQIIEDKSKSQNFALAVSEFDFTVSDLRERFDLVVSGLILP